MANQFQSITTGLAMLKNAYRGPIIDLLNEDIPIYRACEKVKEGWSGYQIIRPLRVSRNQGIGATSDGGLLPAIGAQGTVQSIIASKFLYLRFGITGPMIAASASDAGSFVRDAAYELKMGYMDLSSDLNRQLSWDGTGDLATISVAAVASASVTIAGRESTEPALKFIDSGMVVDIVTTAGAYKAQSVTINSVSGTASAATATVVFSTPVTAAVGDVIIRSGSLNNEVQGLLYALDGGTSTIYNVNRASYPAYQGNVTNVSLSQLSLNAMQGVYNEGLRRGSVSSYNANFCDFTSLAYYQKLLTPDKRYVNTTEGDGTFGKKGKFYLEFNGVPMVPDKDCPTRMFFLPSEVFKMYELKAMEFADETGSMYIAQTDTDQLEVRIRHFVNMFNEQPAACAVLQGYISP